MTKKIGVLGSGDVAHTLAAGFKKHGYDVRIGSRTPEKLAEFVQANPGIAPGTFEEVAAFGEIIVLAVKGTVADHALQLAGAANLKGKVVIDVTNPIADEAPDAGVLRYFTNANESLMERLQKAYPEARFVKAFNSVGSPFMVNPSFPGGKPTMFYCGDDAAAKADVATVIDQFGWEPADFGGAPSARPIEALCQLWCVPGITKGEWAHAFKLFTMQPAAVR